MTSGYIQRLGLSPFFSGSLLSGAPSLSLVTMLILSSFSFLFLPGRMMVGLSIAISATATMTTLRTKLQKISNLLWGDYLLHIWLLSKICKVQCPVPWGVIPVYVATVNTICRELVRYSFFIQKLRLPNSRVFFAFLKNSFIFLSFHHNFPVLITNPLAFPKAVILFTADLTVFTLLTIPSSLKHFFWGYQYNYLGFFLSFDICIAPWPRPYRKVGIL